MWKIQICILKLCIHINIGCNKTLRKFEEIKYD